MRRPVVGRVAAALAVVAVALAGCSRGDDGRIQATAVFDDVADLTTGAPVQMSDVRIGQVTSIELTDDHRVEVRVAVDEDVAVPAEVQARLRRTSALGEKFVELRPLTDDEDAARLADGATIDQAVVVPDVEDLVSSGTELFTSISASQLAVIIEESANSVEGRGPDLALLLTRLETITEGYAARTDTITQLIADIGQLASDVSPEAEAHAEALSHLAETTEILDETSADFLATVRSLTALAVEGADLLVTHFDRIDLGLRALRSATRAVATEQAALARVLQFLPEHNTRVPTILQGDFGQVIGDIIICGLPGGGEIDGDRLNDCD
ncbi:MCE family protein [Iamia sp. SCSIO 61187]|uniref:MlaD family protein n=1 Tax=Iamia sp. SCSIO 61187 TaxID=2722752 RepID=UPI001C6317ED|nr:MlaD family protein [Iamia sp. SCSIO 61187]QYG92930.1 MCE family protein [Iamia sp. SCSIO 61187]